MSVEQIRSFSQCVSSEERKQRIGIAVLNVIIWGAIILFFAGLIASTLAISARKPDELQGLISVWFISIAILIQKFVLGPLFAEYNVRKLQAMGATVSPEQFPAVYQAAFEVRRRFNIQRDVRIIVLASGELNAFAIKFARKRVVVVLSELLEGIIDQPGELRALLAHELCHTVLDHGCRGQFELYKTRKYRSARELTCDNAAYAAAGDFLAAKTLLKKLCAGKSLHTQLSDKALVEEGNYLYSGIIGHFLRNNLTHPPIGKRIESIRNFAAQYPPVAEPRREVLETAAVG